MEPASIRTKNPGAMWGNALAKKWGAAPKAEVLHDGLGQDNNIAIFPTFVQGICAQQDLWRSSKNYAGKRFADAINTWDGHNNTPSYIAYVKARVPGITENTIMDDAFWKGPMGIPFLKAQAGHEAGKTYPAPDGDWIEAQKRVFAASAAKVKKVVTATVPTGTVATTTATTASHSVGHSSLTMVLVALACVAVTAAVMWFFLRKNKETAHGLV